MGTQLALPGQVTLTSWTPPEDWTYVQAEAIFTILGTMNKSNAFWIGDAINSAESRFGEKCAQVAERSGLEPETLANYASVCAHIPPSRRREELTFGHHQAVSSLNDERQEEALQRAVEGELTVSQLREVVREIKGLPPKSDDDDGVEEIMEDGVLVGLSDGKKDKFSVRIIDGEATLRFGSREWVVRAESAVEIIPLEAA